MCGPQSETAYCMTRCSSQVPLDQTVIGRTSAHPTAGHFPMRLRPGRYDVGCIVDLFASASLEICTLLSSEMATWPPRTQNDSERRSLGQGRRRGEICQCEYCWWHSLTWWHVWVTTGNCVLHDGRQPAVCNLNILVGMHPWSMGRVNLLHVLRLAWYICICQ